MERVRYPSNMGPNQESETTRGPFLSDKGFLSCFTISPALLSPCSAPYPTLPCTIAVHPCTALVVLWSTHCYIARHSAPGMSIQLWRNSWTQNGLNC